MTARSRSRTRTGGRHRRCHRRPLGRGIPPFGGLQGMLSKRCPRPFREALMARSPRTCGGAVPRPGEWSAFSATGRTYANGHRHAAAFIKGVTSEAHDRRRNRRHRQHLLDQATRPATTSQRGTESAGCPRGYVRHHGPDQPGPGRLKSAVTCGPVLSGLGRWQAEYDSVPCTRRSSRRCSRRGAGASSWPASRHLDHPGPTAQPAPA